MLKVLLAGGGTAGHINPALAIAEIIKEHRPDAEFCFAGNPKKLEATIIPKAGYRFEPINVEGIQRKPSLENVKKNVHAVWCLMRTGARSKQIIKDFKPDLVIGTGGYVSGPVVRKAAQMGIPTAIHEANAFAGVTTKLLSKKVDAIMLTVKETKNLDPAVKDKMTVTGLPVRKAFDAMSRADAKRKLGFDENGICVLSCGGSLGAMTINENILKLLKWYKDNDIKVDHIHSYGTYEGYKDFPDRLKALGVDFENDPHRLISSYINMPVCMAAADLVITRCGASTLVELEAIGRGAVLIPSPMVAENHQYHNGMVLERAGAGKVIEEKDLTDELFIKTVSGLISDKARLDKLGENCASLHIKDTNDRIWGVIEPLIRDVK
ncbi:MAG: UDP-N-acetylglucosamine--N-acetylmuramyl-(pentapeptide) pyrophosphoryl-undecaprenol N-acetylglucosamine transferase [Ruminococcus sp.]|nr:UDP-N-acetylglucosamine--N-acetylmuramyl-(pentapeptide) pyrophosphoryl-undecaprenol N-acetylglucosamine transferase [Ruminococcus sp.]